MYGDAQTGAGFSLSWLTLYSVVGALSDRKLLRNRYATGCAMDQGLTLAHVVYDWRATSDGSCIGTFPFELRLSVTVFLIGRDLSR